MNRTVKALVKRGFRTALAESLQREGYTVTKLQALGPQELEALGVSSDCQKAMREGRPPIPEDVLNSILYRSGSTCCVCRKPQRGTVVHHIEPWTESRSHDEDNLVVLCPLCHDKAHTKKELTRALTPKQLRHHKQEWQNQVREADTSALFSAPSWNMSDEGYWDYFNRQKLMRTAARAGLDLASIPGYVDVQQDDGPFLDQQCRWGGGYRVFGENREYEFYCSLVRALYEARDWLDLARIWARTEIRSLVRPNALTALTGRFHFKNEGSQRVDPTGPAQMRLGYYRKGGIELQFVFDAWECTSSSSYSYHLCGSHVCTALSTVRAIERSERLLIVRASCLAIGTGFTEYCGRTPDVAYTHGNAGQEREEVEDQQ